MDGDAVITAVETGSAADAAGLRPGYTIEQINGKAIKQIVCSELFAGSMQAVKRVIIAGNRSPGYLLGANWIKLQNGGSFMHTILQPLPSNGKIIEDHGVMPDIEVSLDRDALLAGRDSQLEAAKKYIEDNY